MFSFSLQDCVHKSLSGWSDKECDNPIYGEGSDSSGIHALCMMKQTSTTSTLSSTSTSTSTSSTLTSPRTTGSFEDCAERCAAAGVSEGNVGDCCSKEYCDCEDKTLHQCEGLYQDERFCPRLGLCEPSVITGEDCRDNGDFCCL